MTTNKNLLIELFIEELPPKSLKKIGESFAEVLTAGLRAQGLVANDAMMTAYASPRRLAVHVTSVATRANDKSVSKKLMPVAVGLDVNGQPSAALLKKLSSLGADASVVAQLKRAMDGKVETLFYDSMVKGATLVQGLQKALDEALAKLPIAKVMTYQLADGWSSVNFVRPAHGLVALHGAEIVPVSVLGLTAGRETQGHRFEAASATLEIRDADSYEAQMENEGAVIPSFEKRGISIIRELRNHAKLLSYRLEVEPANLIDTEAEVSLESNALIQEVTALVERPNVLVGQFETEFLEVPQECLILTMKANQKYFPLLEASGKLTNKFLIVSNIRPLDASLVIGGNERVLRARLADARFFFDQDRKKPLDSRVLGLAKVVYHNRLGSQGERVERVQTIARSIGYQLGGEGLARQADRTALLAKADLLTDMVGEFPELQGIMGRYYALSDNEDVLIAEAIEDHYKPRFADDELPRTEVGICVALADKFETLIGMFGIGQIPTGDKDPFALRRHALGVVRILIEKRLPLKLVDLINITFTAFSTGLLGDKRADVETFMLERLSGYLREKIYAGKIYTTNEVSSVLSLRPEQLYLVPQCLAAVRAFTALPEAAALAAANKRVGNILKKVEGVVSGEIKTGLLQEPAEQALHQALSQIAPKAEAAFAAGDYTASLQALAALKEPVDTFFDKVMVNTEDAALRANRLALLLQLQHAMNRVADISKLAT